MNRKLVIVLAIVAVIGVIFLWGVNVRNNIVTQEESVENMWSNVETQYQRRYDLIPQLVNTVKGAANYEQNTLMQVVEARSKVVSIDADNLSEANVAKYQEAQDNLTSALNQGIRLTVEQYPDLTATQSFQDLQTELEGTENRIAVARRNFNEAAKDYNVAIRKFPANIIANMMKVEKKGYFSSTTDAENPVRVQF